MLGPSYSVSGSEIIALRVRHDRGLYRNPGD